MTATGMRRLQEPKPEEDGARVIAANGALTQVAATPAAQPRVSRLRHAYLSPALNFGVRRMFSNMQLTRNTDRLIDSVDGASASSTASIQAQAPGIQPAAAGPTRGIQAAQLSAILRFKHPPRQIVGLKSPANVYLPPV